MNVLYGLPQDVPNEVPARGCVRVLHRNATTQPMSSSTDRQKYSPTSARHQQTRFRPLCSRPRYPPVVPQASCHRLCPMEV